MSAGESTTRAPAMRDDGWTPSQWADDHPTAQQAAQDGSATEILLLWTPRVGTAATVRLLEEMGLL